MSFTDSLPEDHSQSSNVRLRQPQYGLSESNTLLAAYSTLTPCVRSVSPARRLTVLLCLVQWRTKDSAEPHCLTHCRKHCRSLCLNARRSWSSSSRSSNSRTGSGSSPGLPSASHRACVPTTLEACDTETDEEPTPRAPSGSRAGFSMACEVTRSAD
uniref:Uncharacterized protein n=1 Tax=Toxoplasma gondii (strain ATCC 50861 / VEG) TaxID=432359 RepID=A0A0F7UWP8_TOXGV|nr:TPA: hypothetical protein BN1205_089930 [Toxoplasma gondii VEG]